MPRPRPSAAGRRSDRASRPSGPADCRWAGALLLGAWVWLVPPQGLAQGFGLDWFTIDGGGTVSTNDLFELHATLGQADAGMLANSNGFFQLQGGFWPAAVPTEPSVTSQPVSVVTDFGSQASFSILASGDPPLHYQWRRNGVNLAGETNATLTLINADLDAGGTYEIVVENARGTTVSAPATLQFNLPVLAGADQFSGAVPIQTDSGLISADNLTATIEPGEPLHGGKLSEHSVWYAWTAPATGIASFRTRGSGYDTVLAVYTGNNVAFLTEIASDDDAGTNLTSRVQFNATAGVTYHIAVAALGFRKGFFVLGWDFESTTETVPRITLQPKSIAVPAETPALFHVEASGTGLSYQWRFNGAPIAGATASDFLIPSAHSNDLGSYSVVISNGFHRFALSRIVSLQFGSFHGGLVYHKLEDLFLAAQGLGGGGPFRAAGTSGGFDSVSLGVIGGHEMSVQEGSAAPCPDCGVSGGVMQYFTLVPEVDGLLTVDTISSTYDTVLTVYRLAKDINLQCDPGYFVRCDNNGAPDQKRSIVRFIATAGTEYLIGVDGVNGEKGDLVLNWKLCPVPGPFGGLPEGGYQLTVDTNGVAGAGLSYTWRTNGLSMGVVTRVPSLVLPEPGPLAADYDVQIHIPGKSTPVNRAVGRLLSMGHSYDPLTGLLTVQLRGAFAQRFIIEGALQKETNCCGGPLWAPYTPSTALTNTADQSVTLKFPAAGEGLVFRLRPELTDP